MVEGMKEGHQPFAPLGNFYGLLLPLGIEEWTFDQVCENLEIPLGLVFRQHHLSTNLARSHS